MIIPIASYKRVKRKNSLGKIYYKYTFVWDSNFKSSKDSDKNV